MDPPEDALAMAERHVRVGEERVALQTALIEEMERDNHRETAAEGRKALVALQDTLAQARERLRAEREKRGLDT
jgi:hypothetical protein